ncbi:MAG TPA: four helix bundle protein [Chitinophagaceae bacterium]|nr:four helix bundle protein [Chitinophagaceae bacterium]
MGMHKYRELKIWQRSMDFAVEIYKVTAGFPKEERYGLCSQLRSSYVSVASNIAEGAGRGTNNQFKRFLEFAMGSINEAQTQIELSFRIGYINSETCERLADEGLQIYKDSNIL